MPTSQIILITRAKGCPMLIWVGTVLPGEASAAAVEVMVLNRRLDRSHQRVRAKSAANKWPIDA
jgi:hypothetical protein